MPLGIEVKLFTSQALNKTEKGDYIGHLWFLWVYLTKTLFAGQYKAFISSTVLLGSR